MTLYISHENQTLLWQMIQKTQQFNTVFQNSPLESKTTWFKNQIQTIYSTLPPNITREHLKQCNRDTLTNMIKDLTKIQPNMIDRPPYSRLTKDPSVKSITEYETQYRSLLETPKPKIPDFAEKIDDQPISDMDSLIKEHQKQREEELKNYGPPPILPEQKIPLQIEAKEPTIRELKEISKRLDSLEKKLEELIEIYKKSQPTTII